MFCKFSIFSKVPHVQFQRQSCEGQSALIRLLTVAERMEDKLEGFFFIRPQDENRKQEGEGPAKRSVLKR